MQSVASIVPHVTTGMRYTGARIAAGFADPALVAEILEIPVADYLSYEDILSPMPSVSEHMARLFGVSRDYLVFHQVANEREELAELIANGLAQYEVVAWRAGRAIASRHFASGLAAIRARAGHASPEQAAAALGLNPMLYLAQEGGERRITPAQLCVYAVVFGMRPDNALLGAKPAALWPYGRSHWWQMQRRSAHVSSGALVSPAFDWLAAGNCASPILNLPLVEFVEGRWTLLHERLELPRTLVPIQADAVGETLFAMVDRKPHCVRTIIADPGRAGRSSVRANGLGELRVFPVPAHGIVDPTRRSFRRKKGDDFIAGAHIATLATRREE